MGNDVKLWPGIEARIEKEWSEGYLVTAIRVNDHTRGRLGKELAAPYLLGGEVATFSSRQGGITYIQTPMARILVKVDPNMPDDSAVLQVDVVPRKYSGPIRIDVEGKVA